MIDKRSARKTGICETREELSLRAQVLAKKNLTNKQIGAKLGVSNTTISRILRGDKSTHFKTRSPDPQDHLDVELRKKLNNLWRIQPEPELEHDYD